MSNKDNTIEFIKDEKEVFTVLGFWESFYIGIIQLKNL